MIESGLSFTPFLLKALLGAWLFLLILWWARNRQPRAAGMMLTFPAVNGLGLLTAETADRFVMARAMIPMIALNGVLCALYILVLRQPDAVLPGLSPRTKAGVLLGGCLAIWGAAALWVAPWVQASLVSSGQILAWLGGYTVCSVLATALWLWIPVDASTRGRQSFLEVLQANMVRVSGMLVLLVLVMLLARHGAEAWAGRLSAFPLIPFYSLLALSPLYANRPQEAARLGAVGSTVLFGPPLAMAFAWVFAHYLTALALPRSPAGALTIGVAGLLILWGLCGLLIWGVLSSMRVLESRRPRKEG
jgi:hypothetical protein